MCIKSAPSLHQNSSNYDLYIVLLLCFGADVVQLWHHLFNCDVKFAPNIHM